MQPLTIFTHSECNFSIQDRSQKKHPHSYAFIIINFKLWLNFTFAQVLNLLLLKKYALFCAPFVSFTQTKQ
jgi:hypothetical protein